MLFALDYFEKNINSDLFYNGCKFTLIPKLKAKCVIVMDNASFHMSEDKAKHCFARVQDESCARVYNDCLIGVVIACYFYHPTVLI